MENKKRISVFSFALCAIAFLQLGAAEPVCHEVEQLSQRSEPTPLGDFEQLPLESTRQIVSYLPYRSLERLGQVSSSFYSIVLEKTPLHLWTTKKIQTKLLPVPTEGRYIDSPCFSPDGNILAVCCGPDIRFFNVDTGHEKMALKDIGESPYALFSPVNDNLVVIQSSNIGYALVNILTNERQELLKCELMQFCPWRCVKFSNNGRWLVFSDKDSKIWVWAIDKNSARQVKKLSSIANLKQNSKKDFEINTIAFGPENELWVIVQDGHDGYIHIYELDIEHDTIVKTINIRHLSSHLGARCCVSPDGTKIAIEQMDRKPHSLLVWDLINNKKIVECDQPDEAECMTFSPDCQIVAVGLFNNIVILEKAETGEIINELKRPDDHKFSLGLTFSPGGDMVAAGCDNGTIVVWQAGE